MKFDPTSNIDFVDQNSRYMDLLYKDNKTQYCCVDLHY